MRKIFLVLLSILLSCLPDIVQAKAPDPNILAIKEAASQIESETKNFYNANSKFFIDGRYSELITRLGAFPDEDLNKALQEKTSVIMEEFILIAQDRKRHPDFYRTIAQYFESPPPYKNRPAVWTFAPVKILPEHLNSEYRLAWEERILNPHIGKRSFMSTSHALIGAIDTIQKINNPQSIPLLGGVYSLSCEIQSELYSELLRRYAFNALYVFSKKAPKEVLKALFQAYYSCNEQKAKAYILSPKFWEENKQTATAELTNISPESEYGLFLKLGLEQINQKKMQQQ